MGDEASAKLDKLLEVGYHTQLELQRFNEQFTELFRRVNAHDTDLAVLKTKAGIWGGSIGAVAAAIVSAVVGVIVWALGGKT